MYIYKQIYYILMQAHTKTKLHAHTLTQTSTQTKIHNNAHTQKSNIIK